MPHHPTTGPDRATQRILRRLHELAPVALALSAAARGHDTTAQDGQPLLPTGHAAPHRRLPPGSTPPDGDALRASDALRTLDDELRDLLRRSRLALGWGKHMYAVSRETGARCPWCGQRSILANLTDRWVRCTNVVCRTGADGDPDEPPVWDLDDQLTPGLFGLTAHQLTPDHDPARTPAAEHLANPNGHDELPFNVEDHPTYQPGDQP